LIKSPDAGAAVEVATTLASVEDEDEDEDELPPHATRVGIIARTAIIAINLLSFFIIYFLLNKIHFECVTIKNFRAK